MLDLKPRPSAPQAKAQPANSWRNYYRVYRVLHLCGLGHVFPGIHGGPSVFASQDIAESHARSFLAILNPPGRLWMEFAGAYPEGDKAN